MAYAISLCTCLRELQLLSEVKQETPSAFGPPFPVIQHLDTWILELVLTSLPSQLEQLRVTLKFAVRSFRIRLLILRDVNWTSTFQSLTTGTPRLQTFTCTIQGDMYLAEGRVWTRRMYDEIALYTGDFQPPLCT